jgi:hypothetical protein
MVAVKPAPESGESKKELKVSEPVTGRNLRGMAIIIAIIAIAALSMLYALSHNLFVGAAHSTTSTTLKPEYTSTTATSTVTASTTIIPVNGISVHTSNSAYSENSIIRVSGSVFPVPPSSGVAMLVSVTNPRGVQVEAVELPLSSSGIFGTNFVSGGSSSWINGTYTITSNCCGLSGNTAFNWSLPQPPARPGLPVSLLCSVYSAVHNVIFLLCILLMMFGAAMYASGHAMPGAHKTQFQNYGMGLIIGSLIGVTLAVLAPFILHAIAGNSLPIASCTSQLI